jgi:hypothetical protein
MGRMSGRTAGGALGTDIGTGSLRKYITLQEVLSHSVLTGPDPSLEEGA